MIKWLERLISPSLHKVFDKKISGKVIVFESDDWGSIRMASKESFDYFVKKGFAVDGCVFNRNDSLEGNEDLEGLLEVLSSVKNQGLKSPVFTLNMNMGNPDFESIKSSWFSKYFYETFDKTFKRNKKADRVLNLYKEGINSGLFYPQFHGREHVHVHHWLDSLNSNDLYSLEAFQHNMFTVSRSYESTCKAEFLDSFAIYSDAQEEFILDSISDGLNIFESVWNFRSTTAIAPCYTWDGAVERALAKGGVSCIQSGRAQIIPLIDKGKYKLGYHSLGAQNHLNQCYLVRNVYFEPATNESVDWVDNTLLNIEKCFERKVPAIVSSHRVNYIGSIRPSNRDRNLGLLKRLLMSIVKKWPDVEFVTSANLALKIKSN